MILKLAASPNVYSWEDHSKFPIEDAEVEVKSFKEAREITLQFIETYELGGSNISSGKIFDKGELIAKVTSGGSIKTPEDEFFKYV